MESPTQEPAPEPTQTEVPTPVTVQAPPGKHREMVVLNKRKVCWAKRDAYFACLDKNGELYLAVSLF